MERAYQPTYPFLRKQGFSKSTERVLKRRREDGGLDVLFLNHDQTTVSLWTSDGINIWSGLVVVADHVPMADDEEFLALIARFPPPQLTHQVASNLAIAAAIGVVMVAAALFLPADWKAASLLPGLYFFS